MPKKTKMMLGVLIIVGAMAYLMVAGFSADTGFQQVSIKDLLQQGSTYTGQHLLVEGKVLPDSIEWNSEKVELKFEVTDGEQKLAVLHYDVAPDNLDYEKGAEAILKGKYDSMVGVFIADIVETKCPSKYEPAEE